MALAPLSERRVPEFEERRTAPEQPKRELKYAPNRVVRSRETHPIRVHTAIKDAGGRRKAPRLSHWLRNVEENSVTLSYAPPAKRRRMMDMCRRMLALADTTSGTTIPGHNTLAEALRCSERTIGTYVAELIAEGFLVLVAPGRSAEFVPLQKDGTVKGTKWAGKQNPDAVTNERAVYAFTEPLTNLTLETLDSEDVDNFCYPTTPGGSYYPTHARGDAVSIEGQGSALTEKHIGASSGRNVAGTWEDRSVPNYGANATTDAMTKRGRRANELQATLTLQRRNFPMRRGSAKHIAWVLRPAFEAGYTIRDIEWAIDHFPNGGRWPHDGADGVANVPAWLRNRLRPWIGGATALYPPSKREAMRRQAREEMQRKQYRAPVTEAPKYSFDQGISMLRAAWRLGQQAF